MKNTHRRYSTTAVATAPELRSVVAGRAGAPAEAPAVDFNDLPDEALFERYQDGDDQAFTHLVGRYEPLIKGFLFKRLKDEERVQDLTQDTFLRVHRARERYDTARKFSTWIYTIASNLLKNEYRNRSRRRETAFSDLRSEGAAPRPVEFESDAVDPERLAYRGELRDAIEDAIGRLEDHHVFRS